MNYAIMYEPNWHRHHPNRASFFPRLTKGHRSFILILKHLRASNFDGVATSWGMQRAV
jgi:hypothetical protein